MFLITVGTEQYQFNALMHWIELLVKYRLLNEEILVQYGASTYIPDGARAYRKLSEQELLSFVDAASLIISHCDEAVVLSTCVAVRPNPSLKRSTNGRPPGPGLRYGVHFLSPGPGVLPLAPA